MERLISSPSPSSSSLIPRSSRLLFSPPLSPSLKRPSLPLVTLKPISASLFSKQEGPSPASSPSPLRIHLSGKESENYPGAQPAKVAGLATPLLKKVASSALFVLLSALLIPIIQPILVRPAYATTVQSAAQTSGKLISSELLSSAWTGLFAGCLHTLSGPDHLAALAPLSIGRTRVESALVGALWGCGHDAGQMIFGLIFLLLKDRLHIEVIRIWGTRVVGLTLLVIGAMGIREASEAVPTPCVALENGECDVSMDDPLDPAPSGKKKIGFATFATGIVHGLQPDALMMVLPALALPSRLAGAAFLGMFLVGTVLAMGSYTVFIGSCSQALKTRIPRITEKLTWAASILAISMGVAIIISQFLGFSLY